MNTVNKTKQVAWISIGSGCSFLFALISSVILSRYFNKDDYGTYKQVMYIYSTLLAIFTLGLPNAYSFFLAKEPLESARSLVNKISLPLYISGVGFSIAMYFGAPYISYAMNNPDLVHAMKIFSPVPALMLPTMGINGILATYGKGKVIAFYSISTKIASLLFVVLPVYIWNASYVGALVGFVISSVVTLIIATLIKMRIVRSSHRKTDVTLSKIMKFAVPMLYAGMWGLLLNSSDQFFISRYFGKETFAEFANGCVELPIIGMIVSGCATVLSPVYARLRDGDCNMKEEALRLWVSVFKKSALIIYPFLMFSYVFCDYLMVFLYGDMYEVSSIYYYIKSFYLFFSVMVYGPLLVNVGKVKFYAQVHMYMAISVVVCDIIAVSFIDIPYVIPLISLLCRLVAVCLFLVCVARYFEVRVIELFPFKILLKLIVPSLLILIFIRLLIALLGVDNSFGVLVLSFVLYLIAMIVYEMKAKLGYIKIVEELLKK